MTARPPPTLPPLMAARSEPCRLHPNRSGAWLCAACGRGHCDECRNRTERRTTPPGSCLQCGGRLTPLRHDADAPGLAGFRAIWRQAYGRFGLVSAAALALPVLYGSVVVSIFVPAAVVTAFCAWTYFLAVLRWRLTGHADLPMPARALEDMRGSMAVLGTLLAVLVALTPALLAAGYTDVPLLWLPFAALGVLWIPVPLLSGAGSANQLAPLLPRQAMAAVRHDVFGYLFLSFGVALQALGLGGAAWLLGRWLVFIPALGVWLTCIAVLPGAWAIASQIGGWGRTRLADLAVDGG